MKTVFLKKTFPALAFLGLFSCSLAPTYHRPEVAIAQNYKEAGDWVKAKPETAEAQRKPWWEVYNDSDLNALEEKLGAANQDLKAAVARYDQARAAAGVARADYFPAINATAGANRQKFSQNTARTYPGKPFDDGTLATNLSYEIDLWGRIRNAAKAGKKRAQASKADLAAMDLSLRSELAINYFALRANDQTKSILDQSIAAYQKALELTEARHQGGAAAEIDVDRAETQLENAKTLALDTALKRAQLEHAIAVLVGETPSSFTLPIKQIKIEPSEIALTIPSTLLEHRPDIAAAELRMQAANANIGVARTAYFPNLNLSAAIGFESATSARLLNAPSLFWSLGPSAALNVFNGGKINALTDSAHAAYEESVANYRQTVLNAVREVEDNLIALNQLSKENETQTKATAAANRALTQSNYRYKGGIATYLDVVVAQNTALQAEIAGVNIRTQRLTANVLLIKALGG